MTNEGELCMKGKPRLILSVILLITGMLAVDPFLAFARRGASMTGWIVALLVAIALMILGVIGIIGYHRQD